jgi:hypothetical protein
MNPPALFHRTRFTLLPDYYATVTYAGHEDPGAGATDDAQGRRWLSERLRAVGVA